MVAGQLREPESLEMADRPPRNTPTEPDMTELPRITQEMINLYDRFTHVTNDRAAFTRERSEERRVGKECRL